MVDIPCIYKMNLVDEKDILKEDLLKGKTFEILLSLLSGSKTAKEIAKELSIASFSVQLYLKRLIEANLVRIKDYKITDEMMEKNYELVSTDIQIINYLKENNADSNSANNLDLLASQFSSITRDIIKNVDEYQNKPHKIKAYFIKADDEKIQQFKNELEALFDKYQAIENLDAEDTYGFIGVLAPYNKN